MSDKDFCSIGNACMWHLGWRVKLSELQALLCLPSSRQAWSSSILAPVWFSAQSPQWFPPHPPALPTTGKNLCFWKSRIWPYRLFTITFMPGKMVLFFLPLCLLSLSSSPNLTPEVPSPTGTIFMDLSSVLSNQLECCVQTDFLAQALVGVNSLLKDRDRHSHLILWDVHRQTHSDAYSWWGGGRENQQVE